MTPEEYDEHLKGRSDYIKATKKDSSNEKKVRIKSSVCCILFSLLNMVALVNIPLESVLSF